MSYEGPYRHWPKWLKDGFAWLIWIGILSSLIRWIVLQFM